MSDLLHRYKRHVFKMNTICKFLRQAVSNLYTRNVMRMRLSLYFAAIFLFIDIVYDSVLILVTNSGSLLCISLIFFYHHDLLPLLAF